MTEGVKKFTLTKYVSSNSQKIDKLIDHYSNGSVLSNHRRIVDINVDGSNDYYFIYYPYSDVSRSEYLVVQYVQFSKNLPKFNCYKATDQRFLKVTNSQNS